MDRYDTAAILTKEKNPNSPSPMDLYTYEELIKRVVKLESALAINDTSLSPTLVEQLDSIRALWNLAITTHPILKILYDLGETFSNTNVISSSELPAGEDPDIESKLRTISLQSDAIVEAHANLCRFDAIDKTKAINPFNGLPLDFHGNNVNTVISHAQEIKRIAKNYDIVLLKSMLVFEQYAVATSTDNAFWVNSMLRLRQLDVLISKLEREKEDESRY